MEIENFYKDKAIWNHFVNRKTYFFDPFNSNENGMFGISKNLCKSSFNTTHDNKSKSSLLEEFSKANGNNFEKRIINKDKNIILLKNLSFWKLLIKNIK